MGKFSLKHGIFILIFDGLSIGIEEDAEYWALPKSKQKKLMASAQNMLKYARDFETLDRYAGGGCYFDLNELQEVIVALKRINENPFVSPDMRRNAAKYLEQAEAELQPKDGLKRSARKSLRKLVYERDAGRCRYCGELVPLNAPLDHVIPYSLGGKTDFDNLVVSCMPCNSEKRDRTPEQARMKLRKMPKQKKRKATYLLRDLLK